MTSSNLAKIIMELTNNHELDPKVDQCKVNDTCQLKSGHEVTFVSLIADYLLESLRNELGNISFHNWVYIPSRRAENKIGYDLSIGKYDNQKRVRTMHKLLLSWCDQRRSWTLTQSRKGDYKHVISLYHDWNKDHIIPFLVIHICYCIHDYRRMGLVVSQDEDDITLPGVESLLRTVIIPLNQLFTFLSENNFDVKRNKLKIKYFRHTNQRHEKESIQNYWNRIAQYENHIAVAQVDKNPEIDLEILKLSDWRMNIVSFLKNLNTPNNRIHLTSKAVF